MNFSAAPRALLGPACGLAVALCAGAVLFLLQGVSPLTAYGVMLKGALGSTNAWTEVGVKAAPLLLTGLAVSLAARLGLWNIGCEGQLVMGGISAAGVALFLPLPASGPSAMLLSLAAAMLGGGLYALLPGLLRVYGRVSEILTTLLLNYVAILLLDHLYYGPWRDPAGFGFPGTAALPAAALLPRFFSSRLHLVVFLALGLTFFFHLLLRRTRIGFEAAVIGASPRAAAYAMLPVGSRLIGVMAVSGAVAGLAGAGEVLGIHHRLQEGLAGGYGYDGIIVAWLTGLSLPALPVSALLLAVLLVGADQLQSVLGLPSSLRLVLEAALLFGMLLGNGLLDGRFPRLAGLFFPQKALPETEHA